MHRLPCLRRFLPHRSDRPELGHSRRGTTTSPHEKRRTPFLPPPPPPLPPPSLEKTHSQKFPRGPPPPPPPRHVAIIMDGNGRWARLRGLPRAEGHRMGIRSVRAVVECARE